MGIGWAACNLVAWLIGAIYALFFPPTTVSAASTFAIFAIASGIVIAVVWLVIFLPVDLVVSDTSSLRQPATAWVAGMVAAIAFTFTHLGTMLAMNGNFNFIEVLLPELLFTGVTGSVAAYARCRLETRKSSTTP
jgi:hypothetical protein